MIKKTAIAGKTFLSTILFSSCILLFLPEKNTWSQDRIQSLQSKLIVKTSEIQALEQEIDISVSDLPIQEFVRGIANNSGLNIHVDPTLNISITNNYKQVKVIDILVFLCKEYNLDIKITGNILSLVPYSGEKVQQAITAKPKEIKIEYSFENDLLSVDLYNDSLYYVAKKITDISGKNVLVNPEIGNLLVTSYFKNTSFNAGLDKIAYTNKLFLNKTSDNFYIFEQQDARSTGKRKADNTPTYEERNIRSLQTKLIASEKFRFHLLNDQFFSIEANNLPIGNIIECVADTLGINTLMVDEIEGSINIKLEHADFESFLDNAFMGSPYDFLKENDRYIIGKSDNPNIQETVIVSLRNRTYENISTLIPPETASRLVIQEYREQNSIILTGPRSKINKAINFIQRLDKVVPLVLIEIIIVDVRKSRLLTTGMSAGIDPNRSQENKIISPGIDYEINGNVLNDLFNRIDGIRSINLGRVTPDFYLSMKAMEENGIITIRSTPKLATLNGYEAILTSGETKYYKEERSNIIGTQNPTLSNSATWKPINADLSVTIKPIVSGNDMVILDIDVNQSEFTGREFDDSPPGSVTRNFKSIIRVKNQEMILLGGLEKLTKEDTTTGLPLLARIPVIKWLFSNKTRKKSDTKLNIFIQPTIIF